MENAKRPFRAPPACLPRKAGSEISETALRFSSRPLGVEKNAHVRSLQGSYPGATDTPRYLDDHDTQQSSKECSRLARSAASSWCTARRHGGAGSGLRKSLQGSYSSCHCYPVVALEQPTLRDISTTRASDGTGMRFYEMDGLGLPAGIRLVALGALLAKRTFRPFGPKNSKIESGALGASPSVQARSRGRQAPGKRFAVPLPRSAAEVRSFKSRSYPVAATHSPVSPPPRPAPPPW